MLELKLILKKAEPIQLGLLRIMLLRLGIPEQDITENIHKGKTYLSLFLKSRAKAEEILARIHALKLKGFRTSLSLLRDNDWKSRWKKYVIPFNITPGVRVVPLWKEKPKAKRAKKDIYIDTTFAFGTGLHATTRMMASFAARLKGGFLSFFDIGTGSGILSIIAHKYGAGEIYAIDIDKPSIRTARRNFRINHCRGCYLKTASFDNFRIHKQFDLVAANLLTEDLIRLQHKLASHVLPGKYLAVSGIHQDNYRFFRKKFKNNTLKCLRVLKQKGWYALLFRRRPF